MLELTKENFETEVLKSPVPVVVDFWATWCNPCKQLEPIIEELSKEYKKEDIKISKMNVGDHPQTAGKFAVLSLPSVFLFKGGKVVEQIVGSRSNEVLIKKIEKII